MNQLTQLDVSFLGNLPPDVRSEVEQWRDALRTVTKPVKRSLERIAAQLGVSVKTARRKYDAWRHSGFSLHALVNKSKVPETESALTPEFIEWFKLLAERNQRKTRPAYRVFLKMWRAGEPIPGLDNSLPRYCAPPGVGYDNVIKKTRDEFAKLAMRRGLGVAIAKCGPQIFTTRANLWCMSHVPIDDLWHDNFVVFSGRSGARAQLVRVLELDAMDVFSGNLIAFGTKPRIEKEDGTMDNLKEKYARLLVANIFFNTGYSPRGTFLMAEHGTAAVAERIARILHDRSGGLIRLRESGMTGAEQVICGRYGQAKGTPRFKAALESIRSLKHNELAALPMQTGKDVEHRPEFTHGQLKDCADLLKAMAVLARKNPQRAAALQLNTLDYHSQFLPLLMDVYKEINHRTWHELEGWHAAGNMVIEYRTAPSSDHWLSDAEFSELPEVSKQILLSAAVADRRYIQTRRLSPAEVFARHASNLTKLPPFVVGELLGEDMATEEKVRGAYFNEISCQEIHPEPLRFESAIYTPEGQRQQLPDGTYQCFLNPFDAKQLFVCDARKVCLGVAPRVAMVDRADNEQLKRAYGHRASRLAELQKPILARHAQTVREETKRLEHNARVLDTSKPFTPDEIAEAEFVKERGADAARAILSPSSSPNDAPPEGVDAGDELLKLLSQP